VVVHGEADEQKTNEERERREADRGDGAEQESLYWMAKRMITRVIASGAARYVLRLRHATVRNEGWERIPGGVTWAVAIPRAIAKARAKHFVVLGEVEHVDDVAANVAVCIDLVGGKERGIRRRARFVARDVFRA